jgi:hypothetical protein
LYFEDALL